MTGFGVERRLVRGQRQLVLNEGAERLGDEVELACQLFVGPAQPVEPDAEPFVELGGASALQPCAKSVSQDRSL